ncbi:SMI1/KNR4 family protein [Noviherbaspirillum massiliense]|uniref:SMI1/KNR4 family protein n=1 Tax=Noviherbaspirillum massiliense TaxID=1465823 RepID=UPI0002F32571|nr:SMI1/KNR4 family protein [Noviherbaspirillum massiliense]
METAILTPSTTPNADVLLNAYYQIVRFHLTTEERLAALEADLGTKLPAEYASFLKQHRAQENMNAAHAANPDYWDVHALYEFADGPIHLQIDKVYRLVADTLPSSLLPIAEDSARNFYCLVMEGPKKGQIVFLNGERKGGKHEAENVAPSFAAFLQGLIRREI